MSTPGEPMSWRVLEVIAAQIATISIANGFLTDIGATVSLDSWRATPKEQGDRVVVAATQDSFEPIGLKSRRGPSGVKGDMTVTIEFVQFSPKAGAMKQAHRARADILAAVRFEPGNNDLGIRSYAVTGRAVLDTPDGLPVIVTQITATVGVYEATPPPSTP